jgi:hypothetical protein
MLAADTGRIPDGYALTAHAYREALAGRDDRCILVNGITSLVMR